MSKIEQPVITYAPASWTNLPQISTETVFTCDRVWDARRQLAVGMGDVQPSKGDFVVQVHDNWHVLVNKEDVRSWVASGNPTELVYEVTETGLTWVDRLPWMHPDQLTIKP